MIKANELRIGNYFQSNVVGTLCIGQIHPADFALYDGVILSNIEPIPLTEEWLIKFGFSVYKHGAELGNFSILKLLNPIEYNCLGVNLKYVHQLQNLYFCLCGEELTIK